jgi:hypothetical protein
MKTKSKQTMKTPIVKFSMTNNHDVKEVGVTEVNGNAMNRIGKAIKRIDEEGLFRFFTADIIKMKIKFTR